MLDTEMRLGDVSQRVRHVWHWSLPMKISQADITIYLQLNPGSEASELPIYPHGGLQFPVALLKR